MTSLGLSLRIDRSMETFVTFSVDARRRYTGIWTGACGNFDDQFTDEIKLATNRHEAETYGQLHSRDPCSAPASKCRTQRERDEAKRMCSVLTSRLFQNCHDQVSVEPYINSCEVSVCASSPGRKQAMRCQAISAYTTSCAHVNIVIDWRTRLSCARSCGNNMVYMDCGPSCRPSCGRPLSSYILEECGTCVPGCHCQEGHVMFNGTCIQASDCPCGHNGIFYDTNDTIQIHDTCQICTCGKFGLWNCSYTSYCYSSCSVFGPGVVTTFDGEEFMLATNDVACNFILVYSKEFNIEINLLTSHAPQRETNIVIRGFEVKIKNHHVRVEQVSASSFEVLDMKSATAAILPYLERDVYIRQPTANSIAADFKHFRVMLFDMHYLVVSALNSKYSGLLRGLCGNLNSLISDERVLMSGIEANSDEIFIQAYSESSCGHMRQYKRIASFGTSNFTCQ
ncbi:mucin-6-like [Physella acuta]|uniref:mucin-6-like n=1 Tax=Physella acuta TaxID=109671 RepID=UPI0027DB5AD6|nr:mucin-6-like [Physella acuta]